MGTLWFYALLISYWAVVVEGFSLQPVSRCMAQRCVLLPLTLMRWWLANTTGKQIIQNELSKNYQKSIFLSLRLFQNTRFPCEMPGCRRVPHHPNFLPDNVKMFFKASLFIISAWETSSEFRLEITTGKYSSRLQLQKKAAGGGPAAELRSPEQARSAAIAALGQCRLTVKRGLLQTCLSWAP